MKAQEITRKPPVTIKADESLKDAARAMDEQAVGALVVVDTDDRLLGIVTDRDIAVRGVARGADVAGRVDNVMTTEVVSLAADADAREALQIFRDHPFRRLPLVAEGRVTGMLTVDDLAIDFVTDLSELIRPITGQVIFGHPEPAPIAQA